MFKLKFGNTRIALIIFKLLVIKFPNPRMDWIFLRMGTDGKITKVASIKNIPRLLYTALIYGVAINLAEALIYWRTRSAKYLTPVFTIGICNFQFYQGEEQPTHEELQSLYDGLSEKLKKRLEAVSLHDQSRYNWRKTPKGLRLIDYGADPMKTALAHFLIKYDELNEATTRP